MSLPPDNDSSLPYRQRRPILLPRFIALAAFGALLLFSCLAPTQKVPVPEPEVPYESMAASVAMGNPQGALDAYESALKSRPQARETRTLHARLLILAGKLEEAREELDLLLAEEPRDSLVLYNLSVIAGLEGNRRKQKDLLTRSVEADPQNADALASLGDITLEGKDTAAAGELFRRALAVNGGNLVALLGQGEILTREKDYEKAAEVLGRAIAAEPTYSFAYVDRARALRSLGDLDGAIRDLSEAIRLDPSYAWNYLDRGKLYIRAGKTPQALEDLSVALRLDASLFEAYAVRAELLYRTGKDEPALADYEKLVSLRPDYSYAWFPLGTLYMLKADWPKAHRALREAFRFDGERFDLALLAALSLRRAGKGKDSVAYLQDILPRIPRESWEWEVARFLSDPGTDFPMTARIEGEKNKGLRARMLFYVASAYLAAGKDRAALSYLLEIENTGAPEVVETRLAAGELARLSGASR
jgi:tetratricopeptide (TPR) repeat protein